MRRKGDIWSRVWNQPNERLNPISLNPIPGHASRITLVSICCQRLLSVGVFQVRFPDWLERGSGNLTSVFPSPCDAPSAFFLFFPAIEQSWTSSLDHTPCWRRRGPVVEKGRHWLRKIGDIVIYKILQGLTRSCIPKHCIKHIDLILCSNTKRSISSWRPFGSTLGCLTLSFVPAGYNTYDHHHHDNPPMEQCEVEGANYHHHFCDEHQLRTVQCRTCIFQ